MIGSCIHPLTSTRGSDRDPTLRGVCRERGLPHHLLPVRVAGREALREADDLDPLPVRPLQPLDDPAQVRLEVPGLRLELAVPDSQGGLLVVAPPPNTSEG